MGCNWVASLYTDMCFSCSFTENHPESTDTEQYVKLAPLEKAKRKLFYQLNRLGLPLVSKRTNSQTGLQFDFLTKDNALEAVTGHADGIITILLSEADSVHREEMRKRLSEPYRTILGHFRHEIAHYYWMLLFKENNLKDFRKVFGDERADYGNSLKTYYDQGAPVDWQKTFISTYASSHPWEDWAETWAHYLHIMDTLETAKSHKLSVQYAKQTISSKHIDPYTERDFKIIFHTCIPILSTLNSMNRSMGLLDLYPFTITENVFKKLEFIHTLLSDFRKVSFGFSNMPRPILYQ